MLDTALDDLPRDDARDLLLEPEESLPPPHLRSRIRDLARQHASGDLTCAEAHAGLRAHLQDGRLTWAHDLGHPRAFAAQLCELTRLDPGMVDLLAKQCLQSRLPLGETLVALGHASREQVRAAVRGQIDLAFRSCRWCASCRAGFREARGGPVYDAAITFSPEELDGGPAVPAATPVLARAEPEPTPVDWSQPVDLEQVEGPLELDDGPGLPAWWPGAPRRDH